MKVEIPLVVQGYPESCISTTNVSGSKPALRSTMLKSNAHDYSVSDFSGHQFLVFLATMAAHWSFHIDLKIRTGLKTGFFPVSLLYLAPVLSTLEGVIYTDILV